LLPIYKIDPSLIKRQLVYSLPFGLALILNQISVKFDKFFINQYITAEEFAVYSMAFLGIPVLKQFFQSIHNVVVPEISKLISEGDMGQATLLWQKTVDKTSSVTIPLVFLFFILADELITILYTDGYIEAANYYRVFLFIFLISMFSHELILRGSNKTRFILYSNMIGAVITIGIAFLIIPKFGLYGAVYTALAGSVSPMIISLIVEKKIMNLSLKNWINWKRLFYNFGICISIALPLYLFKDIISNIFIRGILVGLIYGLFVVSLQLHFDLFLFKDQVLKIKKALIK
jgi:O-antigen/teichoic acid export membrane protein